jgi:hypothetical protein
MSPETRLTLDQPAYYRILIQGRLPANWNDFFGEMSQTVSTGEDGYPTTIISGEVSDQSSLHGMLRHIRDLGLPLLEIKVLSEPQSSLGENMMSRPHSFNSIFNLVCKAVALAMAIAAIVLNILKSANADTLITLLTMGLAALSLAVLTRTE